MSYTDNLQIRDTQTLYASIGQTVILLILIGKPDHRACVYERPHVDSIGFGFFRLGNTQDDVLPKIGVLFFIPINASFRQVPSHWDTAKNDC